VIAGITHPVRAVPGPHPQICGAHARAVLSFCLCDQLIDGVAALYTLFARADMPNTIKHLDGDPLLGQASEKAAHSVWRPACRGGDLRTTGAFVGGERGKNLRLLCVGSRTRSVGRLVRRCACCQRGANGGDGAGDPGNARPPRRPVRGVEQGLRSAREAIRASGRPSETAGGWRGLSCQHRPQLLAQGGRTSSRCRRRSDDGHEMRDDRGLRSSDRFLANPIM
jgi:hypothetical protein